MARGAPWPVSGNLPSLMPERVVLVVPCFNEARRLDCDAFRRFTRQHPAFSFIFVNDGSTDDTQQTLELLTADANDSLRLLNLPRNGGKAEAVRQGMLAAAGMNAAFFGYCDADLATPLDEFLSMLEVLRTNDDLLLVMGSRVRMLGRAIERHTLRHYVGRIFATVASITLAIPVYDTQCGAKLLRCTPQMQALFREPFLSGWSFDVEMIRRLISEFKQDREQAARVMYEQPLRVWRDVEGSKVKPWDLVRALWELVRVWHAYR